MTEKGTADLDWLDDAEVRASLTSLIKEDACEVCALLVRLPTGPRLVALRSVKRSSASFAVPECEWRRVEQWIADHGGTALCLIHSHPGNGVGSILTPSESDLQNIPRTPNLPWVIVARKGDGIAIAPCKLSP